MMATAVGVLASVTVAGPPESEVEEELAPWLKSEVFHGGVEVQQVFSVLILS